MEFNKVFDTKIVSKSEINYFWTYYPRSKGFQDKLSEEILILKDLPSKVPFSEEVKDLVNRFAGTFVKYVLRNLDSEASDYIFCSVPSHQSGTENKNGIYMLSKWCKSIRDYYDKDILVREEAIESLHSGGNRDIQVHLESIKVNKNVKGKKIVIMDDVTTTGNSLEACKILLEKAGAKEVILFSFSKTVFYSN